MGAVSGGDASEETCARSSVVLWLNLFIAHGRDATARKPSRSSLVSGIGSNATTTGSPSRVPLHPRARAAPRPDAHFHARRRRRSPPARGRSGGAPAARRAPRGAISPRVPGRRSARLRGGRSRRARRGVPFGRRRRALSRVLSRVLSRALSRAFSLAAAPGGPRGRRPGGRRLGRRRRHRRAPRGRRGGVLPRRSGGPEDRAVARALGVGIPPFGGDERRGRGPRRAAATDAPSGMAPRRGSVLRRRVRRRQQTTPPTIASPRRVLIALDPSGRPLDRPVRTTPDRSRSPPEPGAEPRPPRREGGPRGPRPVQDAREAPPDAAGHLGRARGRAERGGGRRAFGGDGTCDRSARGGARDGAANHGGDAGRRREAVRDARRRGGGTQARNRRSRRGTGTGDDASRDDERRVPGEGADSRDVPREEPAAARANATRAETVVGTGVPGRGGHRRVRGGEERRSRRERPGSDPGRGRGRRRGRNEGRG